MWYLLKMVRQFTAMLGKPVCPVLSIGVLLFSLSCADDVPAEDQNYWESFQPFTTDYHISNLQQTTFFLPEATARGEVALKEASGLAWSRNNPGFLWAHQDSGNENQLFLLDSESGEIVATYQVQGTRNRDWEDIEIAPGPLDGRNYLYIGDVGDNDGVYGSYTIYRFEEPRFRESHRGSLVELEVEVDELNYRYPGQNHDVEALMVDPFTKDIYLVTKRDAPAILYVAPFPQPTEKEFTVLKAGELPLRATTAATVSEDGREILIKTYYQVFYWQRQDNKHLVETLSREPRKAPYNPEVQGEAISFDNQGGYYTLSELRNETSPVLYYYSRQ